MTFTALVFASLVILCLVTLQQQLRASLTTNLRCLCLERESPRGLFRTCALLKLQFEHLIWPTALAGYGR